MNRWIFFAVVLIAMAPAARADVDTLCLKPVEISITSAGSDTGVTHIADNSTRKAKITLLMNVDCKTSQVLVPSSPIQAKHWLDLALPYDFKAELMSAQGYFSADVDSSYGASVEYDLYNYFNSQWKLQPNSEVCKAFPPKPTDKKDVNWCFYQMLDSMRRDYKTPKKKSLESSASS